MAQVVWVSETTSPERDRVCDRALDQFGTGAILHSFPKKDVSFPVRNRGSAGVPATQSWEAVSDRSERWRKWSGFPRPLPLKEIAFATVHWTNSGRAPSFTLSLDFTSRAVSPQLADSLVDRRPPHLFGWRRWRGLRLSGGQQVPAGGQRPEPAAELLRLAALHPQGTRPGRRHAHRLPADEFPGGTEPRGRAAANGRRDQQACQLARGERA